jgi:hypothetical protein
MGRGRVGVIMARNFKTFCFYPPHPALLPLGEKKFPNENLLAYFLPQKKPPSKEISAIIS